MHWERDRVYSFARKTKWKRIFSILSVYIIAIRRCHSKRWCRHRGGGCGYILYLIGGSFAISCQPCSSLRPFFIPRKNYDWTETALSSFRLSRKYMSFTDGRSRISVIPPSIVLWKAYHLRHIVTKHNLQHRFKKIDSYDLAILNLNPYWRSQCRHS